jgi:methylenetetrahydrofolate reductase (NADPH)
MEFFPPQTAEGQHKLRAVRGELVKLKPEFFSVTFGAGGSTRDRTLETVLEIHREGTPAAPHLSCIGARREDVRSLLDTYKNAGIKRLVALRGDLPSGTMAHADFRYANELVDFIRAETGDWFHIEVGAYPEYHPQAKNPREDLLNFKRKVEAGANSAITQYFFNADAYLHFVGQTQSLGVDIPIIPGIMPIANFSRIARFSDACGAEIPRWVRAKLESFGDDADSIRDFGLDVVTELCERLLAAGAPGLHFYTLNQAALTCRICERLGLA